MADDGNYADILDSLSPLTPLGIDPDQARLDRAGTMARLMGTDLTPPPSWMNQDQASAPAAPTPTITGRVQPPAQAPAAAAPTQSAVPASVTPSGNQTTPSLASGNAKTIGLGQQNYSKASQDVDTEAAQPSLESQTAAIQAQRNKDAAPLPAYDPQTGKLLAPYRPSFAQKIMRGVEGDLRGGVFTPQAILGAIDPAAVGGTAYGAPNDRLAHDQQQQQSKIAADDRTLQQIADNYKTTAARNKQVTEDRGKLLTALPDVTSPSVAQQKESATPDNLSAMYSTAVSDALSRGVDPSKDPKVQELSDSITSIQKQANAKEPARDDKAIAIYAKPQSERTPEENAYIKGYEQYVKTTKVDPGVARTNVWMQMPTAVADPNNPGGVIYTTRKGAIGQEAPQSVGTQVAKRSAIDFTSGPDARTLTNFNTAQEHLKQLDSAATALGNGDTQLFNRIGNDFATATGSPAPTNFDAVKNAVAGEVSKTFKGSGATDAEISQIENTINRAQSPAQLRGAIKTYSDLMQSKKDALRQQYEQGREGHPNFKAPDEGSSDAGKPDYEYVPGKGMVKQ